MSIFSGRIGRGEFILGLFVVGTLLSLSGYVVTQAGGLLIKLIFLALLIAMIVFYYSLFIRRLHDTGKSGLWSLVNVIPVLNLALVVYLLFKAGETGKNKYGKKPATMMI